MQSARLAWLSRGASCACTCGDEAYCFCSRLFQVLYILTPESLLAAGVRLSRVLCNLPMARHQVMITQLDVLLQMTPKCSGMLAGASFCTWRCTVPYLRLAPARAALVEHTEVCALQQQQQQQQQTEEHVSPLHAGQPIAGQ